MNLQERARRFHELHQSGTLVLPNAWDAASAALIAEAGAAAVATTSSGVSWALGVPDGEQLGREEAVAAVARIARTVAVPVSADVEGGYGPTPADVADTIAAVIDAGAVGVNLEDRRRQETRSRAVERLLRHPPVRVSFKSEGCGSAEKDRRRGSLEKRPHSGAPEVLKPIQAVRCGHRA